jgi:hypothetical protein
VGASQLLPAPGFCCASRVTTEHALPPTCSIHDRAQVSSPCLPAACLPACLPVYSVSAAAADRRGFLFQWLFFADPSLQQQAQQPPQQAQQQQPPEGAAAVPAAPAAAGETAEDREARAVAAAVASGAFAAVLAALAADPRAAAAPLVAADGAPALQQAQAQQQAQQPPWLLAVKLQAKLGQLDWLDPGRDPGAVFTVRWVLRSACLHLCM